MTPPTAAPPTVPRPLPLVRADPATPPTAAPMAVFFCCDVMLAQPAKAASVNKTSSDSFKLFMMYSSVSQSSHFSTTVRCVEHASDGVYPWLLPGALFHGSHP